MGLSLKCAGFCELTALTGRRDTPVYTDHDILHNQSRLAILFGGKQRPKAYLYRSAWAVVVCFSSLVSKIM